MALYNDTGSNLVKFNFNQNPLAKELTPTKKDLDMAVWGLPEMDGMDNYDLDTEKDIDMETMQGEEYFKTLQNLTQLHSSAKAKNINISNPGKDPNAQQFSKEWLSAYYENIQRGKELKQSLDNRETYAKYVNSPNTVAIPLPKGEIVTSDIVNNSLYRYDDAPIRSVAGAYKNREYYYDTGNITKEQLQEDYQAAKASITNWLDGQPPQFREQLRLSVVEPYLAQMKEPIPDQYKIDKFEFDKQKQAENVSLKQQGLQISQQNANTSRTKALTKTKEQDEYDNGYAKFYEDLSTGGNTESLNALLGMSIPVNQKQTNGTIKQTYIKPTKVSRMADGSIQIVAGKETISVNPTDEAYNGLIKAIYDHSIEKDKTTPYNPKSDNKVVNKPQNEPTIAPKPVTTPKKTTTPKVSNNKSTPSIVDEINK